MKRIYFIVIISLFATAGKVSSQNLTLRFANRMYDKLAYSEAAPAYERVLEVDSTSWIAKHRVADCYRLLNNAEKAAQFYQKVMELPDVKPIEKYYYGQALMQLGKYEEAKYWLSTYKKEEPKDERAPNHLTAIEQLDAFMGDSSQFKIFNYELVNTENSEFGPAIYQGNLLFSSNRFILDAFANRHRWTNKDFYRVFLAEAEKNTAVKFHKKVQSRFNVGPVAYDEKNQKLYITKNLIEKGKVVKAADAQIKLNIFSYTFDTISKSWTNEESFAYNNKDYNVAHPAISKDGKVLVFSSDMPGGYGGMDLYYCINNKGSWSEPKNLGNKINSKGNEMFPFLYNDMIFFSSNGQEGIGGLDIYFANFKNQTVAQVKKANYPLNTNWDDFNFIIEDNGKWGYFVSNRPGGKGDDDIYRVQILKPFSMEIIIKGKITNSITGLPLAGASIDIKTSDGLTQKLTTDNEGNYSLTAEADKQYVIMGEKENYLPNKTQTSTEGITESKIITCNLALIPNDFALYGLITDKQTKDPLKDVSVEIINKANGSKVFGGTTNDKGDFFKQLENVTINDQLTYTIKLEKEGYLGKSVDFTKTIEKPGVINLHEFLDVSLDKIDIGTDLGKIIDIKPIYFDLGKHNIRPDAAAELDKIVKVMTENPNMVIELGSHTDCRGTAASNEALSDRRAKSSAAYVVSKGIDKSRIYGKGYGESKLVNDCACEGAVKSNCTEEQHQQNRRTEFIIVKM